VGQEGETQLAVRVTPERKDLEGVGKEEGVLEA